MFRFGDFCVDKRTELITNIFPLAHARGVISRWSLFGGLLGLIASVPKRRLDAD
jgi:hypothetical protein